MKQFQLNFTNERDFRNKLVNIKKKIDGLSRSNLSIYVSWSKCDAKLVDKTTRIIEKVFPNEMYYGNETSGNIVNGELSLGVSVTVTIWQSTDVRIKFVWVEQGTKVASLEDLWRICNETPDLKAVELIPSVSYPNVLGLEGCVPNVSSDIFFYGGTAVEYILPSFSAGILYKGRGRIATGMIAVLYAGNNLHFYSSRVLGWKGLGRYLKVTKSERNVIKEIDNKPAFEIFEKYLDLQQNDQAALSFPIISNEDGVEFIRTPQFVMPDKSMTMFANIAEGTDIRISYGDKNTILTDIYNEALRLAQFKPEAIKVFSCAARRLFWGDSEIAKETIILQKVAPVSGFCTGGEIQRINGRLRLMNQTLTIAGVREGEGVDEVSNIEESIPDTSLVSRLAYFTGKVAEEQEEALQVAKAASEAKTNFLFNMSHDIRTPLNAIIGFNNIAAREINNPDKALESIKKAHDSSDILLSVINDILDMSRIESGKVELKSEPINVASVMKKIHQVMKSLAAVNDIDLTFEYSKLKNPYIYTDVPYVERILINIISNAIKYTLPEGKVSVSVEQIGEPSNGVAIYKFIVSDNGIGMSEEFQKHMYEEFSREANTTLSGVQGTGLGLSLALKLTTFMGGSMKCVSKQGVGTTFTIVLPFKLQPEEEIVKYLEEEKMREADLKGKRLLLVEDNELNMEIAYDALVEEGLEVETASNGQIALDLLREKGPDYYDCILMDIQMPIMNGYEAAKAIRKLYPESYLPIIALSANAFQEDKDASMASGMNDHIAKPIDISQLRKVLSKFI